MSIYDKCDAHLAAALFSNFAGYEFAAKSVSLLIELVNDDLSQAIKQFEVLCNAHNAQWVQAHTLAKSRFLTGNGSLAWLKDLQNQPWIARLALANQLLPNRPERINGVAKIRSVRDIPKSSSKVLLGVVEHGCPFAHEQLLDSHGHTRVLSLWDQDTNSDFEPALSAMPERFGYGAQVDRNQLNKLIGKRTKAEDELQSYQALGYSALEQQFTHGAHTLSLFSGNKLSRSLLQKTYGMTPELHTDRSEKFSAFGDVVFVQLPKRGLLSPSSTGMSRSILDGIRYIVSHAGEQTERVVICIPYGSSLGPHDGTSVIEQALDDLVKFSRRKNLDIRLVFSSGNAANKAVYARTISKLNDRLTVNKTCSQIFWIVPPNLQANTSLEMWFRYPDREIELFVTESTGFKHSVKLSSNAKNTTLALKHQGKQIGVMVLINDLANKQLNVLLQLLPSIADSNGHMTSGRWTIQWQTDPNAPVDAHFYAGWGGRNRGFGQRLFPTKLLAGSVDIDIPEYGSILGTACGQETYVVGGCYGAPSYSRVPYSGGGKPRGGKKARASCLSVTEESFILAGLACSGVRSGSNARSNGTSVAAPIVARMLADNGSLSVMPFRSTTMHSPYGLSESNDTRESPVLIG